MSTVFEIKSVSGPKEWVGSYGPMFSYKLDLEHDGVLERQVELNRKPESRAPEVGERLAGNLEEGRYGDKLKIDFDATKELNQGPRQAQFSHVAQQAKGWQPETERDPERAARILRQHSQEMALRALVVGKHEAATNDELRSMIQEWTDWFDADVSAAGQKAGQGSDNAGRSQEATAPPSSSSPTPDQPSVVAVTHQELCEALDTAGLTVGPARDVVAGYMAAELPEDRMKVAFSNLVSQDTERQARTLKALKEQARAWSGRPLPQGDALDNDDRIPF